MYISNVECRSYIVLDITAVLNKHKIYELKALKIYHSDSRHAEFPIPLDKNLYF